MVHPASSPWSWEAVTQDATCQWTVSAALPAHRRICRMDQESIDRILFESLGCEPADILHVAQVFEFDIDPAHALGWDRVWIIRYGKTVSPAHGPHYEIPDLSGLPALLGLYGRPNRSDAKVGVIPDGRLGVRLRADLVDALQVAAAIGGDLARAGEGDATDGLREIGMIGADNAASEPGDVAAAIEVFEAGRAELAAPAAALLLLFHPAAARTAVAATPATLPGLLLAASVRLRRGVDRRRADGADLPRESGHGSGDHPSGDALPVGCDGPGATIGSAQGAVNHRPTSPLGVGRQGHR